MIISGRCHCSNISYVLDWQPEPSAISARACTCSFCTRHGGVWTSCPTGSLKVTITDSECVSDYAFGTETAQFRICTRCGVVPVVTSLIDDRMYAVVNVNTFENVEPSMLQRSSVTLDDESGDDRLARRKRNWIAELVFVEGKTTTD
jgi:hypothetical protein